VLEAAAQDGRQQLHTAHELHSGMGAEAFAARAARELRATGRQPRKRTVQPADALTAQEQQQAGLTSRRLLDRVTGAIGPGRKTSGACRISCCAGRLKF
jgi:hypothetical protein